SETAKKIGAVNTIVNRDGKLYGYNTDFWGMNVLIRKNGIDIKGKKVLILGSGGTSKTANAVSRHLGAREIYTVSRSEREGCITYETALKKHSDAEIIINTTPSGMYPNIGESAVDVNDFPNLSGVVDAVYNPLRPKLVCDARRKGIPAIGGLYMLVAQAAYAAEKFVDQSVPEEKIEAVYKSLVLEKQNIVLIGMPGCGKSTIGKILAKELSMQFVDSDDEIVKKTGKSIPEIFTEKGESGFREIEGSVIAELSKKQHTVIATGGGAILNRRNIELLSENGRIYFIDRPLSEIAATTDRPLSSNRADLKKRYSERYDSYLKSCDKHIKVQGSAKDTAKIIKEDFQNEATCD
ncbi:MAG: shikimate kinase, partial [Oscillospiraceae bacterium]|nr:shikimate kinase [Oscillospiraceae bacterium]